MRENMPRHSSERFHFCNDPKQAPHRALLGEIFREMLCLEHVVGDRTLDGVDALFGVDDGHHAALPVANSVNPRLPE
jgi:hypothetical protein